MCSRHLPPVPGATTEPPAWVGQIARRQLVFDEPEAGHKVYVCQVAVLKCAPQLPELVVARQAEA